MNKNLLLILLLVNYTSLVIAQTNRISGTVTSQESGEALPGVNVLVKNSTAGTVTDIEGNYSLNVTGENPVLQFSFIGFVTAEEAVNGRTTVDMALSPDLQQLSEVVVTGYGERSKEAFTGSVGTVEAQTIENKPFTTVDQALQGNVAGLQLSASSGTPGSVQDIRIRGISSITASNDPLFVIDGVPVVTGEFDNSTSTGGLSVLSSLNSNDIASISVLKDASATALYGARGANGVIIITTKRGQAGKPVISLSAQRGTVERAVAGPNMLSAPQWDELYYEARVNAGQAASIAEARELFDNGWDGTTSTDWRDVVTNDDAITQNYDVSVRGGNDKSKYYASLGYFQQDGVNIGADYNRTTGKLNYDNTLSERLTLSTSTNASYAYQKGQLENASWYGSPDAAVIFLHPINQPLNPDGTLNLDLSNSFYNPLYVANNNIYSREQAKIFNSTNLEYKLTDNLTFNSTIGLDYLINEELYYEGRAYGDGAVLNGTSYTYVNRNFNWNWKNRLDYRWQISDEHQADFKVVYEAQKNNYYSTGAGGYDIAADGLYYPSSVGTPDFAAGFTTDWAINSILGVVNYAYRGNLFFDGTIRREGNSRFAPGNRWGTFYSVGASWVFSDEAFMEGLNGWLNTSKLRASYGKTGNAGIDLNQYQALLNYGGGYGNSAAVYPSQFGNTDLTWENNLALNFGLDFGVFNRFTGTVEYFRRRTYDLLLDVPLSYTSGFNSQTRNVGEMVNRGWEVSLNTDILKETAFRWNLGLNFTSVQNEVTRLPRNPDTGEEIGIVGGRTIVTEGEPVYAWDVPTWAGVNPDTGAPLWYISGTGGETTSNYADAERTVHGSAIPTFYGGLTNRFDFKGIYLTASLYYSTGNNVYDSYGYFTKSDGQFNFTVSNGYADLYDRWQQPGDMSENPRNVFGNTSNSNNNSTRRMYSGEYLRLRDLTLGYNLPVSLISKIGLSSANIYLKGNNVWTYVADEDLEFDPEVGSDGELNLNAPPVRTYALGLVVSF